MIMAWYEWAMLAVLAIFFVCAAIGFTKEQQRRRAICESMEEAPVEVSEPTLVRARVISKRAVMEHGGSYKTPTHRVIYYVGFETADGQRLELSVSEDVFAAVYEDQESDLLTVEGGFFAFEDGHCV